MTKPPDDGRVKVLFSEEISALLRKEQEAVYERTGLRVPLAEIARSVLFKELASNTRDTGYRVAGGVQ